MLGFAATCTAAQVLSQEAVDAEALKALKAFLADNSISLTPKLAMVVTSLEAATTSS